VLNGLTIDDFPEAMKMAFATYDLGAIVVEGRDDAAVLRRSPKLTPPYSPKLTQPF